MKLIAGLGNTGEKYMSTRHNAGFITLDKLASVYGLHFSGLTKLHSEIAKNDHLILAKPTTMMNASGEALISLKNYYKLLNKNIYIVHDDLDIKLGEYKIQSGVGPKLHNGLSSIEEKLGTNDFWRVRIGVDNRDPEKRLPGEAYVLENFTSLERLELDNVIEKIASEINSLI